MTTRLHTSPLKYALLIGINYYGTSGELGGCINDVHNIRNLLTTRMGYDANNIIMLTDEKENDPLLLPTKNNIIKQFYDLIFKTQQEHVAEIFVHFSGHGSYIRDAGKRDELDGKDEVLVPVDYKRNGMITDDLMQSIFTKLHTATRCIALFDCCHSGTMMDLPFRYISGDKNVHENKHASNHNKIIMISGCQDRQTSADTVGMDPSKPNQWSGAMTSTFLAVMKKFNYNLTCWYLLKHMRLHLKERNYSQIPQICCSRKLDNTTVFCRTSDMEAFFIGN